MVDPKPLPNVRFVDGNFLDSLGRARQRHETTVLSFRLGQHGRQVRSGFRAAKHVRRFGASDRRQQLVEALAILARDGLAVGVPNRVEQARVHAQTCQIDGAGRHAQTRFRPLRQPGDAFGGENQLRVAVFVAARFQKQAITAGGLVKLPADSQARGTARQQTSTGYGTSANCSRTRK